MKNNDYKDIENMFDNDLQLPNNLSKDNMVKKLKEKQENTTKKTKLFPKIISVAAAFAIVITSAFGVRTLNRKTNTIIAETFPAVSQPALQTEADKSNASNKVTAGNTQANGLAYASTQATTQNHTYAPIDIGVSKQKLSKFASEAELKQYFSKLYSENAYTTVPAGSVTNSNASAAPAAPGAASDQMKEEIKSFADTSLAYDRTNTQVDGVDEADIIKNDGRYLYILSNNTKLTIVDTQTMKIVSTKRIQSKGSDTQIFIDEMYLIGNRLVLIGYEYADSNNNETIMNDGKSVTCCWAYMPITDSVNILLDISDKNNVKEIKRTTQSGSIVSTRVIGSILYTVTRYAADLTDKKTMDETSVPKINGEKLTHNDIYRNSAKDNLQQYIVVSAWDTKKENDPIGKIAVLGNGDEVYCSGNKLYLTGTEFDETEKSNYFETTKIYSFSLNGTSIAYTADGVVTGIIDNQYSIDEHNGYLRLATTGYNFNNDTYTSNLYVLDANLNVIGKLEDIAKNEQVKSSRFMGDIAYIVTFRNTDPLFTVDLSDPANPKITGQVKLPGFSEYLHPVGENLLVGVGYSGDDDSADTNSVKISLFDVSDKNNPKELDSHVIKSANTDVNYNAKAFLFYKEKNLVGIPISYEIYNQSKDLYSYSNQFKFLQIENGKFTEKTNFVHTANSTYIAAFFRGCYIGDKLYTITDESVVEHSITSGQALRTLSIG